MPAASPIESPTTHQVHIVRVENQNGDNEAPTITSQWNRRLTSGSKRFAKGNPQYI